DSLAYSLDPIFLIGSPISKLAWGGSMSRPLLWLALSAMLWSGCGQSSQMTPSPADPGQAQLGAGIIDPNRAANWEYDGSGPLPARTTICTTLNSSTTTTAINNALNSCPTGQTVLLSAGTYTLTGTIDIPSGRTLRGAGPTQTILNMSSASDVCNPGGSQ